MMEEGFLNLAKKIRALAGTGLLYCANDYDRERF